jgi:hypothetical protein
MAAPAGPGGRSTRRRAGRARNPAVADQAAPAGGAVPRGAGGDGLLRAWRPRDAARAGRLILGPVPPGGPPVTGNQALAGRCAPAAVAVAVDQAAGRRAAGARGLPHSPGIRDRRGRRSPPGRSHAGMRRERRQRHLAGRTCLCRARCPDDSPGTSWSQRVALAIHPNECRADKSPRQVRRVIAARSTLFNLGGQRPCHVRMLARGATLWLGARANCPRHRVLRRMSVVTGFSPAERPWWLGSSG